MVEKAGYTKEAADKITQWNPFDPLKSAPFFDPEVMFTIENDKQGGYFDVVIGNPPYGQIFKDEEKKFLRKLYSDLQFKIDAYSVFILKSLTIQKHNSYCTYIIPSTLMDNYFEEKVRGKLLNNNQLDILIELDDSIFESAVVHSMILGFYKLNRSIDKYEIRCLYTHKLDGNYVIIPNGFFKEQDQLSWSIRNYQHKDFISKLRENSSRLEEILDVRQAIKSGNDGVYISSKRSNKNYKPVLGGKHIEKWTIKDPKLFINYGSHLACPRDYRIFEQPKILLREAGKDIIATYDDEKYYIMSSLYNIIVKDKTYSLK